MKETINKETSKVLIREGNEKLLAYLNSTDFFTAPASTQYHNSEESGLSNHSWLVYQLLIQKIKFFNLSIPQDTVLICGLLHDICKINFYERGMKWRKDSLGNWEQYEVWKVNDQFPVGHGEKSVIVLQRFIKLTEEEICAIRWHMVGFDPGIHFNYPSGFPFRTAQTKYPLVTLLSTADLESTFVLEK